MTDRETLDWIAEQYTPITVRNESIPMTNNAPERIFIAGEPSECGHYYPNAVEAEGEHGWIAFEYIRADLAVTVKPLVWKPRDFTNQRGMVWDAIQVNPDYTIYRIDSPEEGIFFLDDTIGGTVGEYRYSTLKEAKAAAQADYEKRIKSALYLTPTNHQERLAAMQDTIDVDTGQMEVRMGELITVLEEIDAWVEGLGYYADDGAELVPVFKKVKAVLGKGYK